MASLLTAAVPAHAARAGDLDPSFSGDGKQTTDFAGGGGGSGVALQPDGKVVVVGSNQSPSPGGASDSVDVAIARYNRDGSLDRSFSGDGKQTTDFAGGRDYGSGVALQPDGKVVVAGGAREAASGGDNFALARYNADGSLDTSFSGDGKQTTDFAGGRDYGSGVALQPDGRVVVSGSAEDGANGGSTFALARYSADGSLDMSFSGDGKQTTDFAGGHDFGSGVALQPDGKVVVAGVAGAASGGEYGRFALARYNADGSLDASFSGDGRQTTDFGGSYGYGLDVALQPDGKIVVAGRAETGWSVDFALARYNADGSLDASFSGGGWQTTDFGGTYDEGSSVAAQPDGKVVVAGWAGALPFGEINFALARYNADGSLDASFSGDGTQTTDFAGGRDFGSNVAVQPDGKVVVAGATLGSGGSGFALARYLGSTGSQPAPPPACTVTGTSRGDVLVGTPGNDVICAGAGNDVVRARGGNDTVYGGPGNDALRADGGSDRLYGQGGNDALNTSDGRRGNDSADGGDGNDACIRDPRDRRRSCSGR